MYSQINIIKKCGLIFIIKKYFKRAGLLIGVIMFFSTLYVLSLFVWNVSVTGNERVSKTEILSNCKEIGVENGVLLSKIDSQLYREMLLLKSPELSWCSLNIEGSKVTVNVSEISKNSNMDIPSNIVSDCDGIITDIYVESGVANVEKGQVVCRGDLLVSGISQLNSVNQFVKSKAVITAEIRESISVKGEFSGEKLVETGEVKQRNLLELFRLKIPFI